MSVKAQPLPVIAGGPAPLIATWLFGQYHSGYAIAAYILACAIVTLMATAMMQDYTGKNLEDAHGELGGSPAFGLAR